ncbi:putative monocarboxylate transporter mch1 [Phlyctochytrium bullatum]|nr:putative monocarboxylate transporter mch1 [Phlyctochytrium bullatum]
MKDANKLRSKQACMLEMVVELDPAFITTLDFLTRKFPGRTPILLIEGLRGFLREQTKELNTKMRLEYKKKHAETQKTGKSRSAAPTSQKVVASKDQFEAALLWLQFQSACFVHHAEPLEEIVRTIISFTYSLGMIPERMCRNEQALKLRFGDTVKSGKDEKDTWRKILMEIKPCTEPVANAVIAVYPTLRLLYNKYAELTREAEKESLLENIQIYLILTGKDESLLASDLGKD